MVTSEIQMRLASGRGDEAATAAIEQNNAIREAQRFTEGVQHTRANYGEHEVQERYI